MGGSGFLATTRCSCDFCAQVALLGQLHQEQPPLGLEISKAFLGTHKGEMLCLPLAPLVYPLEGQGCRTFSLDSRQTRHPQRVLLVQMPEAAAGLAGAEPSGGQSRVDHCSVRLCWRLGQRDGSVVSQTVAWKDEPKDEPQKIGSHWSHTCSSWCLLP